MNVPIEFCAWLIGDNDNKTVEELYLNWKIFKPDKRQCIYEVPHSDVFVTITKGE